MFDDGRMVCASYYGCVLYNVHFVGNKQISVEKVALLEKKKLNIKRKFIKAKPL